MRELAEKTRPLCDGRILEIHPPNPIQDFPHREIFGMGHKVARLTSWPGHWFRKGYELLMNGYMIKVV